MSNHTEIPIIEWRIAILVICKDVMQGKLFQKCTHLLYCSVLSNSANVNTRRIKKSMKYSGHRKLLCDMSILDSN